MALELTDTNFQDKVISSDKLTIVDFWAEWCGPCRAIGPVIEELSKEYDGKINVGKVNVDHNPQLSVNYGITSIPAIMTIGATRRMNESCGLYATQSQPKCSSIDNARHPHARSGYCWRLLFGCPPSPIAKPTSPAISECPKRRTISAPQVASVGGARLRYSSDSLTAIPTPISRP